MLLSVSLHWDSNANLLSQILGSLSLVLSLPILLSSLLFPMCRSQSRLLVLFLTLTNFCQGLYYSIQTETSWIGCVSEAIFALYVDMASFLWTLAITFYVWLTLQYPDASHAHIVKWLHLVCWTYPLIVCGAIGATSSEVMQWGYPWCLINNDQTMYMTMAIYFPLFFSWSFVLIFYILAHQGLRNLSDTQSTLPIHPQNIQWELTDLRSKLLYIPLLFLIMRSFDVIYRVTRLFSSPVANSYWLSCATSICNPSQGMVMGIIFVLCTRKVRLLFWDWLHCRDPGSSLDRAASLIAAGPHDEDYQNLSVDSIEQLDNGGGRNKEIMSPQSQSYLYDSLYESAPTLSRRMSPILINQTDAMAKAKSAHGSLSASPTRYNRQ